jgi:MerR family transcriptional regulator, light-induced transcriptional regulator
MRLSGDAAQKYGLGLSNDWMFLAFACLEGGTPLNDRAAVRTIAVSIAAVERDTGLSKDTLRVWERRYGFPMPVRDSHGERAYPLEQVEKLRMIRRLLDNGHRPGRIVSLAVEDLQIISESLPRAPQRVAQASASDLRDYIGLIKSHDVEGVRRQLRQALMRMGVSAFVCEVVAPLNIAVGDAWMRGQLEIFEEHMYTESMNVVLRGAIASSPVSSSQASPRILLTTFPQEPHSMGLLMAEVMLAVEGCKCISLGTQTPIWDIVLAAAAHRIDIVALSFTASQNPNIVLHGLQELRSKLPASTWLWAGGSCPAIHRRSIAGVKAISQLQDIPRHVAQWRDAMRPPA